MSTVQTLTYLQKIEDALKAAPEGVDTTDLLHARKAAEDLHEKAKAELQAKKIADEEERQANRRKVTIRRREWDADDKVTVEIIPGKFYGQEVYYKGERLGLVDGKKAGDWTASPVSGYSHYGLYNRADAIRALVASAER